jgi:hypothetical protein
VIRDELNRLFYERISELGDTPAYQDEMNKELHDVMFFMGRFSMQLTAGDPKQSIGFLLGAFSEGAKFELAKINAERQASNTQ